MLGASREPLVTAYDLVMFDLDGVVYVGDAPVPGAPEHLARARVEGAHLAYITNNASRPPDAVAAKLRGMGIDAEVEDVVTSAQAAAAMLAGRYPAGTRVVVLGAAGLVEALTAEGLVPVGADEDAAAVVTGYGPDVPWRDVMRVATRIRDGLPWVASNTDLSLPTPFGTAPGHGVMVRMLSEFTGVRPDVAGKPARPLLDETVRRVGGRRPLMVGDRLDTDIEGAHRAGLDSLLVLTGVTGLVDLVAATPELRPTYVAPDLAGLFDAHPAPEPDGGVWACGGWRAAADAGRLVVAGSGSAGDWWRAALAASWSVLDAAGEPVEVAAVTPPVAGPDGSLAP